jgi:pilus assembly protein CpaD
MNHTFRLFALGLIGFSAAACTNPATNGPQHAMPIDQVYPITVEPQVATLVVRVDEGLQSIARGEEARVQVFAERWKTRGQGMLNVAAPTGGPNQAAAAAAAEELRHILAESGIDGASMQFSSYRAADGDARAPITLSFVTYAAHAAECGVDWSSNLSYSPRNLPWPEFGCSTQHNFAAIVSDPRDLIEPAPSEAIDANRRATVFEKYRKGELTGAKRAEDASGEVAKTGQ